MLDVSQSKGKLKQGNFFESDLFVKAEIILISVRSFFDDFNPQQLEAN